MMPNVSMLAVGASALLEKLPLLVLALVCAVAVIAFFIGFEKGFRWVNWEGALWFGTAAVYFVIDRLAGEQNFLTNLVASLGGNEYLQAFLPHFIFATLCVLGALIVYGICTITLRPCVKRVAKKGDLFTKDEQGFDYDDEWDDYDDYEVYRDTTMIVRRGFETPSIVSRVLGGVCCALNAMLVMFVVVAFGFMFMASEPWKSAYFADMFTSPLMTLAAQYISRYGMDILLFGVIIKIALKGYEVGFVQSMRTLFVKIGSLVAVLVAVWLPFSQYTANPAFGSFVGGCVNAVRMLGLPDIVAFFGGKLLCAVLILIVLMLGVWLVHYLLKNLEEGIKGVAFFRRINGMLSCVIYSLIGVVAVVLIWSVLYLFGAYGIFDFGALLTEGSISKGLLDVCGSYVQPLIDVVKDAIKGVLPF